MTLDEFRATLTADTPPTPLTAPLRALWHDAKGHWDQAHEIAQAESNQDGDTIHAYLHRVEGDPANAAYWYRRAGRPVATTPLAAEWDALVTEFLGRS